MSWLVGVVGAFALFRATEGEIQDRFSQERLPVPIVAGDVGGFAYLEGSVLRGDETKRIVDILSYSDRESQSPDGRVGQIFVARSYLASGAHDDREVTWIDGRTCPQLYGVLLEFNGIEPPRLNVPNVTGLPPLGAGVRPPVPISTEARVYSVWGKARQADGATAYLMVEAYNGLVADWVIFARDHLKDCWTDKQPSLPTR